MIKGITFFLLCIYCYLPVYSQQVKILVTFFPLPGRDTNDSLYYSPKRKLTWDDFKGKVRSASPSGAITFTGFSYDATGHQIKDSITVYLHLQVYFDKTGSWVRPENKSAYALSHEQLHFDIAQAWALRFRDTLQTGKFSPDAYDSEIHFLYWDYWRKMTDMEMLFDDETRHGIDQQAEKIWSNKIRQLLLSDSDPDSPRDE